MPRPRRNTDPSKIRLLTIRTENAQLLLSPGEDVNEILGGVLAKYQEEFGIIVYAYCFLSNHYHLLIQAPLGNTWRFAQAINREIAKRINRYRGRKGHFWQRRYDDQIVLEDSDALEALLYVVTNNVHHGLERHPKLWPGLNSFSQIDGSTKTFAYTNYSKYKRAVLSAAGTGVRVRLDDFKTVHVLKVTPLPQLQQLDREERVKFITTRIEERTAELILKRESEGKGVLTRELILAQDHFGFPNEIKTSPRPLCYTRSLEAMRSFLADYFPWVEAYVSASRKFRSGDYFAEFPPFSIRPPLHYEIAPR